MAERRSEGFEPWVMDPWRMDPWIRTMTSAFRFWVSFWPVAPLFGVEWRFGQLTGVQDPVTGERTEQRTERRVSLEEPAPATATELAGAPQAEPAAEETAAGTVEADDLTRIKGIGPGLARQLNELGIQSFRQLAALSRDELAALDEKLTTIKGRCFRDDWVGQAKKLAG